MEKEVDPQVLAVLNEKRLSGAPLAPAEVIAKMGVQEARKKVFENSWLGAGDVVIAALWAEQICVAADGRWFHLESLQTERRPGGGARPASQAQRAKDRLELLKKSFDAAQGIRVVLQTNRLAIAEAEINRGAKLSVRVRDEHEWHVASWEPRQKLAVLVRGERGWTPGDAELRAARERIGMPEPEPEVEVDGSPEGLRAGALAYVTRHFKGYGYGAKSSSDPAQGWDIEVSGKKGELLLRIAVKGVSAQSPAIQLTPEERKASVREPLWRLLVVTDPGTPEALHKIYKPSEIPQVPGIEAQG